MWKLTVRCPGPPYSTVRIKFACGASGIVHPRGIKHPAAAFEWLDLVLPGSGLFGARDLFNFRLRAGGVALILKTSYRCGDLGCRHKLDAAMTNHRLVVFNWQLGSGLGVCISQLPISAADHLPGHQSSRWQSEDLLTSDFLAIPTSFAARCDFLATRYFRVSTYTKSPTLCPSLLNLDLTLLLCLLFNASPRSNFQVLQ